MGIKVAIHILVLINNILGKNVTTTPKDTFKELGDHTMVTDSNVFPYVCAILKKFTYISAGALIDASWVITGGDALYLLRESARELRVRMGSINYKKGGVLMPIKLFEIHPYFSDTKPEFDIALIKLAEPVRLTLSLNPIRIQKKPREITATHFIVTAWPLPSGGNSRAIEIMSNRDLLKKHGGLVLDPPCFFDISLLRHDVYRARIATLEEKNSEELKRILSMEMIKRRRILTVTHLHPSDSDRCMEEMEGLDINATSAIMCLDAAPEYPCYRDVGAPVVLNGILWGVISSWKPEECQLDGSPSFVSLVSAPQISPWIHAVVRGHRWNSSKNRVVVEDDADYEYNDDNGDDDETYEKNGIESLL